MAARTQLGVLMGAAFVETLGSFLVLALLPFWAERYGATPTTVGLLVAAFALAQTVTAPLWGRLSDRLGRRPVIVSGLAISVLAYLAFAFADSVPLLFVCRLAQGVGGGTVSVVFAYLSDALEPERRALGIGWLTSATSLAAMIGPAIGSWAALLGSRAPGLVPAGLSLGTLVLVWRWLPESRTPEQRRSSEPPESLVGSLLGVIRAPRQTAHALIWVYALGMFGFNALTAVIALYLERRFGVTEGNIWILFTYIGGLSIVMRLIVLGPTVRRFGELRVLRWGSALLALGLFLLPFPSALFPLALVVALIPIATALLFPSTTALISRQSGARGGMGQLLGVQQAFGGVSRIVGPIVAGAMFQGLGVASPFWLAGGLMVIATAWALGIREGATPS